MSVPESDIKAIKEWAISNLLIKKVWLFGGRVSGNERDNSDLDIATEHGVKRGDTNAFTTAIGEMNKWRSQLQSNVSTKKDSQSYIPGETLTIARGIEESSILIYEST